MTAHGPEYPDVLPRIAAPELFARMLRAPGAAPALLCVSSRLAQHLFEAHARAAQAQGLSAWETPVILTLEAFLQSAAETVRLDLRRQGRPLPQALRPQQRRLLWRLTIDETRQEQPLLREAEAAQLAAEAWDLVHEYDLPLPLPATTPDVERFNHWAQQYRKRCQALERVDAQGWRTALLRAIAEGRVPVPTDVVLAGFHEHTPSLRRLVSALHVAGSTLQELQPPAREARVRLVGAADAEQELRAAASWAAARLREQPLQRIGVIVPDIGSRRGAVQRLFDEQLCPQAEAVDAHSLARPYNLTLGEPLSDTALPQAALRLLRWLHEPLPYADATALLCSPAWGGGEDERLQRAAIDARLRREGHTEVSLESLRHYARSESLRGRCEALMALRQPQRRAQAGEWVDVVGEVLEAAGWPGARALDSEEYQAHQAWSACLAELGRLESLLGRVPWSAAVAQLREIAEQTLFQPQSLATGVQVMGALEAEGLEFDALWIAGFDDEHWPAAVKPHPFIPYALQRERGLPHASAAQELDYARRLTARWLAAAPEVVLSWPRQEQDRPLAPSPLLAPWLEQAELLPPQPLPCSWQAQPPQALDILLDAQAPPLPPESRAPGGVRLLGDQALCPFRGFATHRLGAHRLEVPRPGINAADRGNLVHRVLESIWRELRDQQGLMSLDAAQLEEHIGTAVDAALTRLLREAPQRLRAGMRRLEDERLRRLVAAWLEQEKLRLPFRVIELEGRAPELGPELAPGSDGEVEFEGLRLRLRRDRVDELEDGGRLVLDYKSGGRRKAPWTDERPEEPQLLIYALTGGGVQAIAYGRLVAGAIGFEGIAVAPELAPGIASWDSVKQTADADGWQALLGRWRGQLHTVATEVREGWAAVTPKHARQTCRDCDLHALCRVRESVAEVAEGEP
ncbi:PD-(D/E)XK nuclease family protein [Solimonas sp. SE-A11]|uniref:PD-(D/E)XK nuclease family protein n=1 Tax=Solimonas sp. SE-A11 TaxID=3054954 RepID=UPI00259CB130|nr:PD-(D/E)XK nuclease family protein [Solimonas sp. SE-A11]MDM4769646.1 PD-(D/E)XK nuclease family protein [Solimonas sp. SE-A11]